MSLYSPGVSPIIMGMGREGLFVVHLREQMQRAMSGLPTKLSSSLGPSALQDTALYSHMASMCASETVGHLLDIV